jgi:hypothetical protein
MRDALPVPVYEAIAKYLRSSGRRAAKSWPVARAHEDSLTGAVFHEFATYSTRQAYVDGQKWLWRVRPYKFGSGGPDSEEKNSGADGIIEIEVKHRETGEIQSKALLVQAKKEWAGADPMLLDQVQKMERIVAGSCATFDYSSTGYSAIDGRGVIEASGNRRRVPGSEIEPIGDFLADRFLACTVGVRGLYYEPRRQLLHLPPGEGRPEAVRFPIRERLRVEVEELPR